MAGDGEENELVVVERELHDAIADVMNRHRMITTKWVGVVEFINPAGERDLEAFTSPDFRAWDSLGMLGFIDARERGATGAQAAREHGGD